MSLKVILRGSGIAVLAVGLLCFPIGWVNPKRALSFFHILGEMGLFWKIGLILVRVGLLMVVLSFVLPGESD